VLVHLCSPNFVGPLQVYMAHVQEWRTQFSRLESVDLRFDGQVIVNPDSSAQHARESMASPAVAANSRAAAEPVAPPTKPAPKKRARKH
jgi:cell division protein FtsQ